MMGHIASDSADSTAATSPDRGAEIESPFARRHVQLTLAVLAMAAMSWLGVAWWRIPPPKRVEAVAERGHFSDAANPFQIVIDLNRAEARELALLPGVGPVLARRIVDNRDRLGPFSSVQQLQRVHGIGPKKLEAIAPYCVVDPAGLAWRGDR